MSSVLWFFSLFLCNFTFNIYLRSLQYIKYFYFRLQLSLVFYYPRYIIVSTSLGSCMQMDDWIESSFHWLLLTACAVSSLGVFPANCWKRIDILILFSFFSSVLILTISSSPSFFHNVFVKHWRRHRFEYPLTDTIERGTCL